MFPLQSVLLPGETITLHVFEARYKVMIRHCLDSDRMFGVALIERGREVGGGDVRASFGSTALIEVDEGLPDGRFALVCRGCHRLEVMQWLPDDPYPQATVRLDETETEPAPGELAAAEAAVRRAWALLSELGASSPPSLNQTNETGLSWQWCALAPLTALDRLSLLRASSVAERLAKVVELTDLVVVDARRLLAERDS
jgi:Lon protease-like protein